MFPAVDTKDPAAVASFVGGKFKTLYPNSDGTWLNRVFQDITRLFNGQSADYAPIDLRYHDLEHTMQATLCLALLLEARHRFGEEPLLDARSAELGIAAALLHDTGYLKLRRDVEGTGAKYTYGHVARSCAFANTYLGSMGASPSEIELVLNAINCTGPTKDIGHVHFRDAIGSVIGCGLGTADYLGQMAAPDYPHELEILFAEFREADEFARIPAFRRTFKSAAELIERTPAFWRQFVKRKLDVDFRGMHRFLAVPFPNGPNPYLEAVERNIEIISRRSASPAAAS